MPDKSSIRKNITTLRDSFRPEDKRRKDDIIFEKVIAIPEYKSSKTVLLYASFRSEIETEKIILHSLESGKVTVLPVVDRKDKRLRLYMIESMADLKPGYMGIPEPKNRAGVMNPGEMEFILVPGVAFDIKCARIGYGRGYYDRLLGSIPVMPFLLAPAYDEQIVDDIPVEDHDIRMDMIVTDRRVIKCKGE